MRQLNLLIKPSSSLCNADCTYCFYRDVAAHRSLPSAGLMSQDTAHAVVDRAVDALSRGGALHLAFQGGEPTLSGLPFFEELFTYAAQACGQKDIAVSYSLQTNGLLLDEAWCAFLKQYDVLVGLSLDGEEAAHDRYRTDPAGGTWERVMRTAKRLTAGGVRFNAVTVVTDAVAGHPTALYRFYRKRSFDHVQLIPCLAPLGQAKGVGVPDAHAYGDFLVRFFDAWYADAVRGSGISVRLFDNYRTLLRGGAAEQCGIGGRCVPQLVVEADGGTYPCDFYVLDEYCTGNMHGNTVEDTLRSDGLRRFMQGAGSNPACRGCRYEPLCGGGCRRYREYMPAADGFCPIRYFFDRCLDRLANV